MKTQPPQPKVHEISFEQYSHFDLANLRCVDYGEQYLFELSYADIGVNWEPESHKLSLEEDIIRSGVELPIITLKRRGNQERLVEGHHRAVLAYAYNFIVPVEYHNCSCPPDLLDSFGLCPKVRRACVSHETLARKRGWDWQI